MLNSGILEVAIGLTVVFILISTVCTAIREALETLLKTRAAYLEYAIRELLKDREGKALAKSFFEHPLIFGLFQNDYAPRALKPTMFARGRDMPSYIPARNFAAALIDIVARGKDMTVAPSSVAISFESLRASVSTVSNPYVQRALMTAVDSAQGDLELARKHLEAWFDAAMDRVSGWYKRATQKIIFLIALVIVVALNVNAISIANTLYRDQALRAAALATAESLKPDQLGAQSALKALEDMRLPIGWHGQWDKWWTRLSAGELRFALDVLTPALGLLLTAFAATLGAPFWFDVLNHVMVLRGTVKPSKPKDDEGAGDRPPASNAGAPLIQIVSPEALSLRVPSPGNDVGAREREHA
jgi:hypothetical protein